MFPDLMGEPMLWRTMIVMWTFVTLRSGVEYAVFQTRWSTLSLLEIFREMG